MQFFFFFFIPLQFLISTVVYVIIVKIVSVFKIICPVLQNWTLECKFLRCNRFWTPMASFLSSFLRLGAVIVKRSRQHGRRPLLFWKELLRWQLLMQTRTSHSLRFIINIVFNAIQQLFQNLFRLPSFISQLPYKLAIVNYSL